jgi:hypothetical protein
MSTTLSCRVVLFSGYAKLARIVALLQVADVAFYGRLGFAVANRVEHDGETGWAWLDKGTPSLMVGANVTLAGAMRI